MRLDDSLFQRLVESRWEGEQGSNRDGVDCDGFIRLYTSVFTPAIVFGKHLRKAAGRGDQELGKGVKRGGEVCIGGYMHHGIRAMCARRFQSRLACKLRYLKRQLYKAVNTGAMERRGRSGGSTAVAWCLRPSLLTFQCFIGAIFFSLGRSVSRRFRSSPVVPIPYLVMACSQRACPPRLQP